MVVGIIQNRDIWRHPWALCRSYGLGFYLRCLRAACDGRSHTFLELWAARSFFRL